MISSYSCYVLAELFKWILPERFFGPKYPKRISSKTWKLMFTETLHLVGLSLGCLTIKTVQRFLFFRCVKYRCILGFFDLNRSKKTTTFKTVNKLPLILYFALPYVAPSHNIPIKTLTFGVVGYVHGELNSSLHQVRNVFKCDRLAPSVGMIWKFANKLSQFCPTHLPHVLLCIGWVSHSIQFVFSSSVPCRCSKWYRSREKQLPNFPTPSMQQVSKWASIGNQYSHFLYLFFT